MNERDPQTASPIVIERRYRASLAEIWDSWTTKAGFESWWGPQGFRVDVRAIEPRDGGALEYEMIADTPEMIAAMQEAGRPPSHATRSRYQAMRPQQHLEVISLIDFLPGVTPYESLITVDFAQDGEAVTMTVSLGPLHSPEMSQMQAEGFTSQLGKLDARFGADAT